VLIGYAIEFKTAQAAPAFFEATRPGRKLLGRYLDDLKRLPPAQGMAEKIDVYERVFFLDIIQMAHRVGPRYLQGLDEGRPGKSTPEERAYSRAVADHVVIMRLGNKWYSRMAQAMRKPTRAGQDTAFDEIERTLKDASDRATSLEGFGRMLVASPAERGRLVGHVLLVKAWPSLRALRNSNQRIAQAHDNLRLAIALEVYHRDHGAYPKTLAALAPKYLKAVPGDRFSAEPLVYKPAGKGYLLYSVGINGKDDGGKANLEGADDIAIRMPTAKK
jgi:hypothetical protein